MNEELIKKLRESPNFKELQTYILSKIVELDSVDGLEKMTNEQAGQEAKVRALTASKLQGILAPFIDFKEKREPTEKDIQQKKQQFGL